MACALTMVLLTSMAAGVRGRISVAAARLVGVGCGTEQEHVLTPRESFIACIKFTLY